MAKGAKNKLKKKLKDENWTWIVYKKFERPWIWSWNFYKPINFFVIKTRQKPFKPSKDFIFLNAKV
jgi:hypothetical protein